MIDLAEKTDMTSEIFKVEEIRKDFPILKKLIHGYPLVYFDNAATTHKPLAVIQRMSDFYINEYGTVRRGIYELSARSTIVYENVRQQIARFLNAPSPSEIVFVKGATEAINLVATGYGRTFIKSGDEIIISAIEHHSNIVPWQQLCLEKGATLKIIPINNRGELILEEYEKLLTDKTRLVAVNYVSNSLGTINPVKQIIDSAHLRDIPVLIDGAQSTPHMPVNVQKLDCDFYVFSGHKLYGPTGIGVLYAKMKHLETMRPYQFGGDMIESVTFAKTTFADPPHKFEAGTPPIAEVIGLGKALEYIEKIGFTTIQNHENELLGHATSLLSQIEGLKIIGTASHKSSLISFVFDDIHPHDIGTLLDQKGIAVRAGHHCTQPVMDCFNVPATTRASFAFYNTKEEIDRFIEELRSVIKIFR